MVIAKHDRAHEELSRQFHDREVDKEYLGGAIARALHAPWRSGHPYRSTGRSPQVSGVAVERCRNPRVRPADGGQVAELTARLADTDIVVANAALPATGKLDDFTSEQLNRALDVNLRVPMQMTQQLLPRMLRRGRGHFVYISSIAGKLPSARVPIYSATKAGLRGFCGSLRQDLHGSGVSASVVFPGTMMDAGMLARRASSVRTGHKGNFVRLRRASRDRRGSRRTWPKRRRRTAHPHHGEVRWP